MKCDLCGRELSIGEWPYCPHDIVYRRNAFVSWIDENLGDRPIEITSLGQWNSLLKKNNCELKDQPSKGEIQARIDRRMEQQKELNRG